MRYSHFVFWKVGAKVVEKSICQRWFITNNIGLLVDLNVLVDGVRLDTDFCRCLWLYSCILEIIAWCGRT